jgi:hypothetical protein
MFQSERKLRDRFWTSSLGWIVQKWDGPFGEVLSFLGKAFMRKEPQFMPKTGLCQGFGIIYLLLNCIKSLKFNELTKMVLKFFRHFYTYTLAKRPFILISIGQARLFKKRTADKTSSVLSAVKCPASRETYTVGMKKAVGTGASISTVSSVSKKPCSSIHLLLNTLPRYLLP